MAKNVSPTELTEVIFRMHNALIKDVLIRNQPACKDQPIEILLNHGKCSLHVLNISKSFLPGFGWVGPIFIYSASYHTLGQAHSRINY